MKNKTKIIITIIMIAIIGVSFALGLFIGQKNAPKYDLAITEKPSQTFYATIESVKQYNDGSFHINVKGLEVNDINYRGDFTFKVDDNIDITFRGEKLKISDLKEGSNISITFTDEIIYDISPTPLKEVIKIQLLENESKTTDIEFVRTYNIVSNLNKTDATGENNFYVVELFQTFEPVVVKVNKKYVLQENENYEFTFKGSKIDGKDYTIQDIFNTFDITNIEKTDKVALEQRQDAI